ncbi:hypothetical protein [Mesoterricola sediminis]|uniref:Uncharacterized protein n=1 Tax=Mesoterricola sediminis TaxID=2927980 RepID=A0AA48GW72_9BACT|nr:hypothetical protein [Mesoterricola sediminis]BDU78747.1 hypothetical protein METESE_37050 [Mesoterricola sediminis]
MKVESAAASQAKVQKTEQTSTPQRAEAQQRAQAQQRLQTQAEARKQPANPPHLGSKVDTTA